MSHVKWEPFEALVTQYERLVFTVCRQLVRDDAAAEDLTQDTFLSAYLHLADCPQGYERQWLARIAANKAKDYLQSAWNRHNLLSGDEEMPPGPSAPSPEEETLSRWGEAAIREAILSQREPYGSVLRLNLLEEKSPAETALALGRPLKTIHTQIARGKRLVRKALERSGDHDGFP